MNNISENFINLSQDEKENVVNNIVSDVCSSYCCRDDCNGCFIQELTDLTIK